MWPFQLVLLIYLFKIAGYFFVTRKKKVAGGTGAAGVAGVSGGEAPAEEDYEFPTVDILLPMYNEEKVVVDTINNLLAIQYDKFSIIVVDDGSTDSSFERVRDAFEGHPKVRLVHQANAGKSAALNRGTSLSQSEIVVSIDADTWVRSDGIKNIVRFFRDEKVAAVAGHIKVGNRVNLLTDMQYYEYVSIWDNDRAFSDPINGILIVPGALAAYRRSVVNSVGGFKSEVIAEDTELTLRLLYNNYVLRNAKDAVAYTEAPDNLRMFFRQRVRWTTGLTQGLVKHSRRLCAHSNKWLAWFILPFTWLFRVIFPFFLPLVDYYFLFAFFFLKQYDAFAWWIAIILTESLITLYLLTRFKERVGFIKLVAMQRMYRHLLFCNYWLICWKWIGGTLFRWGKIARKGNIRLEKEVTGIPFGQKSN